MTDENPILIIFSTFTAYDVIIKKALNLDPVLDLYGELNIGTSNISEQTVKSAVLDNEDITQKFDTIDELVNYFTPKRVLIVDRTLQKRMIPPERLKLTYFLIHTVSQLEDALGIVLDSRQRHLIINRTLPTTTRTRPHSNYGFIRISESSSGNTLNIMMNPGFLDTLFDDDLTRHPIIGHHEMVDVPVAQTRTPLNSEWTKKLEQKAEPESDSPKCVVCMSNEPCIMLVPCSHQCVCDICVKELLERDDQRKQCPICRTKIENIFKPIK